MNSNNTILLPLIVQFVLIIINALFSSAETALVALNHNELEELAGEGNRKARKILNLTRESSYLISTVQTAIIFTGFLASAFGAQHFSSILVEAFSGLGMTIPQDSLYVLAIIFITLILSYITLVFGNFIPKRIAMENPKKIAYGIAGPINILLKLFSPFVWFLMKSVNMVLSIMGIDPDIDYIQVTEEEIRMMVDEGSEKGSINLTEKQMIHNIFEFDNKEAEDVMTHRTEVSLLWLDERDEDWEKTINESKHTYYPICHEHTDNVIGVLNTKDYFRIKDKTRKNILEQAVKPPYFVPEVVSTDILFHNMQKNRTHFAIVMDEYGGMNGILTISDLLEQLVGTLDDDDSIPIEKPLIERIDSSTWKIQGKAPLEMVTDQLGISLPDEDYDTFGGFVFNLLGTIPDDDSTPEIEGHGLAIKVIKVKDRRLEKAIVYVQPKEDLEDKKQDQAE